MRVRRWPLQSVVVRFPLAVVIFSEHNKEIWVYVLLLPLLYVVVFDAKPLL